MNLMATQTMLWTAGWAEVSDPVRPASSFRYPHFVVEEINVKSFLTVTQDLGVNIEFLL